MTDQTLPEGPWLNVGSGPFDPAPWVNVDGSPQALLSRFPMGALLSRVVGRPVGRWPRGVRHRNVRRGLGYPPGSVAVVYASHLLEHLHRDEALAFLKDAHRTLKPGGILRVVVPDVRAIVGWYLAHASAVPPDRSSSDLLMEMLMLRTRAGKRRWWSNGIHEHKWMYDAAGLAAIVHEAGFEHQAVREFLDSAIPREALARVELASRVCDGAGVVVEARR